MSRAITMIWAGRPFSALLEFRRYDPEFDGPADSVLKDLENALAGIRCPACQWRPEASSRWTCWDSDAPEYFYAGCGTTWNTFETHGRCPGCGHQWKWTICPACGEWSLHDDWYE